MIYRKCTSEDKNSEKLGFTFSVSKSISQKRYFTFNVFVYFVSNLCRTFLKLLRLLLKKLRKLAVDNLFDIENATYRL